MGDTSKYWEDKVYSNENKSASTVTGFSDERRPINNDRIETQVKSDIVNITEKKLITMSDISTNSSEICKRSQLQLSKLHKLRYALTGTDSTDIIIDDDAPSGYLDLVNYFDQSTRLLQDRIDKIIDDLTVLLDA